jgi:4-amino-4-deoxy-L-arabinose transferase-like glycosyltransferase
MNTPRPKMKKLAIFSPSTIASFRKSLLIILLAALVFRLPAFGSIKLGMYDERMYIHLMNTLRTDGLTGIRSLVNSYLHHDISLQGPLPFRILFPLMGLSSCKLLGFCGLKNLALVSFISGLGIVIIGFILFREWFSPGIAAFSSLLLVVSPLQIWLSNLALQDSFFTLIVIAAFLFYHRCWCYQKKGDPFALGFFVLAGLLTKESMILFYACFGALALYYRKKISPHSLIRIALPLVIAFLLYVSVSSWIVGGFDRFWKIYLYYGQSLGKAGYSLRFQQGPWFRYIVDFISLSPLTFLLAIIGMVMPISDERNRIGRDIAMRYAAVGFAVFSLLPLVTALPLFNVRLVLFLDVLLRVLSVFGLLFIAGKIKSQRFRHAFIAFAFVILIASDIHQYIQLFVTSGLDDPTTIELIWGNGFFR